MNLPAHHLWRLMMLIAKKVIKVVIGMILDNLVGSYSIVKCRNFNMSMPREARYSIYGN